ncbi:MAG: InlB B-repeat-containing protein [Christensenellales bacterium]|jgi:uncharacterized repeat protein (TIGR02543 family)
MSRVKKPIMVFVSMLVILTLGLSACGGCNLVENEKSNEYFVYMPILFESKEEKNYITLRGLTDAGEKLEYIVIPDEIEGYPVKVLDGGANASNLKKIYISKNVESVLGGGYWLGVGKKYKTLHTRFNCTNSSVGRFLYPYIPSLAEENYKRIELNYSIANLNYLLNYENSTNGGVHFIDDLEVGEKIVVAPPMPTREGYTFKGWYLDEECTEIFNMIKYVRSDDDGIMHVYARWEED